MDYESTLINQKVFNEFQINEIRTKFIQILGHNKTHLGYFIILIRLPEYTNLIHQLLDNYSVEKVIIEENFKVFDYNKDGKLDWNEYLIQFKSYIDNVQCLRYLKSLSSLEDQSEQFYQLTRYLSQLQIAFLTSPFRENITTANLQKVEQTLIQLESCSSSKHIKKFYFICKDEIELMNIAVLPEATTNFNLEYIFYALRSVIQQRLPHVKIYIREYVKHLITEIITKNYFDQIYHLLFTEEEKDQLFGLQTLTLFVSTLNIFFIQTPLPQAPETIIGTVLNLLIETESEMIQNQCYIFMGHLVLNNRVYREILFKRRNQIIDFQINSHEQLLYHSWFIGCLFFRYERNYAEVYNNAIGVLPDNLLWTQSLLKYYFQYGKMNSVTDNEMFIQIQINMLILITPILAIQFHENILNDVTALLQNTQADARYKIEVLALVKQIFKLPKKFQDKPNFPNQNIMLSSNLINILIGLMSASNNQISCKAKKLFFKTLCVENHGILFRYLQESNNIETFLIFLENCFHQQCEQQFAKYFKMLIIQILNQICKDTLGFQYMSQDQKTFNLYLIILNQGDFYDHSYIFTGLEEYCKAFLMHFQFFPRQKIELSSYTIEKITNILPDSKVISEIWNQFALLTENVNKQQPLLVKKYLKKIQSSITQICQYLQEICKLLDQLLQQQQIYHPKLQQQIQFLSKSLSQFKQNLDGKQEFIEDTLLIIGTEATFDGCVVTTVYLNSIKNNQVKCKVILKPQLTLLDFEQQVEKGLQVHSPLLYIVINQNHSEKLPYDDCCIIGEEIFKKFKQLADQFVETQYGSVKIPQEVIAVELIRLKREDYSMSKIYEILTKGSSYYQFEQMQDNKMLWVLENNNLNIKDRGQLLQSLNQLTRLPYHHIERLFDVFECISQSLNEFYLSRDIEPQYRAIIQADFVDYLMVQKIPDSLAQKIANFLSRNGMNHPIDFRDFICFVSLFYHNNYNETIIAKFTYLLYADNMQGKFGEKQLENYITNIFQIQNQQIPPGQLQQWSYQLFQEIDKNKDGQISFYEYLALLNDPIYRDRLLKPICDIFTTLPFESRSNKFFLSSPQRIFRP